MIATKYAFVRQKREKKGKYRAIINLSNYIIQEAFVFVIFVNVDLKIFNYLWFRKILA